MNDKRSTFLISALVFGFAFLYVPIVSMVVFSFNESRLVTVWSGFSVKWYAELFENRAMLDAAYLSLKIAAVTACGATVIGTLAGLVLARYGRFRSRTFFSGMVTAPLVMPEVITGLSLLLLFVAFAGVAFIPEERGFTTIAIAHITLTMAYVTVVVQSRLSTMDDSLEEAAMDLGARPTKVFFAITLPIIAPAMISGWLLAFTLSLDDLVIATFAAGPSTNTLPMMIFSTVRRGITPEINALATIMVGIVTVFVIIAGVTMSRQEKRKQRDVQLAAAQSILAK
jgi:putrescine transport system permease protein